MSGDSNLEEIITSAVMHAGCIKHIDLVLKCLDESHKITQSQVLRTISEMTMLDRVKRLEYVLPNSSERRAVYFPAFTKID